MPKHFQNMTTQRGEAVSGVGWGTEGENFTGHRVLSSGDFTGLVVIIIRFLKLEMIGEVNNGYYSRVIGKPGSLLEVASGLGNKEICCLHSVMSLVHGKG